MTNPVFQEPSVCPEKHDREAFESDAGQRSRAIIPGDDPGDQQLPERGFYSTLVRTEARWSKLRDWLIGGGAPKQRLSDTKSRVEGREINN